MKKGWQTKTIGDVCDLATGGTPSRAKPEYFGGDIKWLVSGDINQGEIFDCEGRITAAGMKNSNAKLLPINSVMIALNGQGKTRGTVALLRTQATCNQSMVSISPMPSSGLLPEFLYANLHGRYEEIRRMTSDDDKDRRGLNMGLVRSIKIPIAPLAEQQRIVGLLDEAFEGLATAKANAEKNLQNARALFESHLQSVFTQRGPGWVETTLDDVTDLITCGVAKRPDYVPEGIPFLSAKNVKSGQVIWSGHQYVSEESHRALTKHNKPKIGDILYTRVGSYGEAAIIDRDVEFSIFVSLTLIKPKPVVLNSFLKHYLNSSAVKELAADSITGSGVGNLNVGTVREFPIHLPPLPEQRSIVSKLDDLREETQRLARLYERKHAALEALKKSLLHQAFTGEL